MAVGFFSKSALFRSVLGSFSQLGRSIAPYTMARRLVRDNPLLEGLNFSAAQAIATQAQRVWEAGRKLQGRSVNALARAEVPIDPTLGREGARYRYRTLVEIYDGGTRVGATSLDIDSNDLLTRSQVQALARTQLGTRETPGRPTMQQILTGTPGGTVIVTILTVGRRA